MTERPGRRRFFRKAAGAVATGAVAACNNDQSGPTGASDVLLAANGERLIKVVSVLGEPLARVRVSAGVGGSAEERFTNEQGDVLLTIADTAPLRFDTPDGRCMPYVTMAGSRKEFPVRLFEHGSASFVEQVTDGVVRRSIRPEWRLVYSSDIAD